MAWLYDIAVTLFYLLYAVLSQYNSSRWRLALIPQLQAVVVNFNNGLPVLTRWDDKKTITGPNKEVTTGPNQVFT